jgi:ribonuclease HI
MRAVTKCGGSLFSTAMSKIDIESPNTILAFTDGSCYPNPNGKGGWAFVCIYGGKSAVKFGHMPLASNNTAELTALIRAMEYVPASPKHRQPFVIYTDSEYAMKAITKWVHGWMEDDWKTATGKPVSNRELIEEAFALYNHHCNHRSFEIRWVKGHSGIKENELVDSTANHARKSGKTNWKKSDTKSHATRITTTSRKEIEHVGTASRSGGKGRKQGNRKKC